MKKFREEYSDEWKEFKKDIEKLFGSKNISYEQNSDNKQETGLLSVSKTVPPLSLEIYFDGLDGLIYYTIKETKSNESTYPKEFSKLCQKYGCHYYGQETDSDKKTFIFSNGNQPIKLLKESVKKSNKKFKKFSENQNNLDFEKLQKNLEIELEDDYIQLNFFGNTLEILTSKNQSLYRTYRIIKKVLNGLNFNYISLHCNELKDQYSFFAQFDYHLKKTDSSSELLEQQKRKSQLKEYSLQQPMLDQKYQPMFDFANHYHQKTGAIRKHSGEPYMTHPLSCSQICQAYGGTNLEIKSCLAHDLIEDTEITADDLEEKFGPEIAEIVSEVTNEKDKIKKLGKENYINQELCQLSKPALFVKLCDIYQNSLDYPSDSQARRMLNNIEYLIHHRKLDKREEELVDSIYSALAA